MTLYRYECECGAQETHDLPMGTASETRAHACGEWMRRVYDFTFAKGMPEHYNPTTGTVVKNASHFRSELTRASDKQSERTGMEHNYQPVDLSDPVACGVSEEGLDESRKVRRDAGWTEPTERIII